MRRMESGILLFGLVALLFVAGCAGSGKATRATQAGAVKAAASAAGIELVDPAGDDNGPGTYQYPTDAAYKPGSFDMTALKIEPKGQDVQIRLSLKARVEDPWDSKSWDGNGFSLQMAFVHIDTDHKPGSGAVESLPGLNVRFKPEEAWDKVVILSPQGKTRLMSEINSKAPGLKDRIVIPKKTRVSGRDLIAVVGADQLGGLPEKSWGVQVLMQSNEGFPAKTDLLTRKVNEYPGEHRFGGGSDWDNDPHVLDIFVAPAKGGAEEVTAQHAALGKYNKQATEPKPEDLAVVPLVYSGQ